MKPSSAALAAAALLLAGCDTLAPGWATRLGHVMDDPPSFTSLVAPAAVTRGVPFQITASTFGSSSCTRADGYQATSTQSAFEVRLYDRGAPAHAVCTGDIASFPRILTVQFDEPGTAVIRVIGRDLGGDDPSPKTVTRTIVVE
jgi:hypothetical protein